MNTLTRQQIKAIRNGLKWSLGQAGNKTGYSRQHIHQVEKGHYDVSDELVKRYTEAVKETIGDYKNILKELKDNA